MTDSQPWPPPGGRGAGGRGGGAGPGGPAAGPGSAVISPRCSARWPGATTARTARSTAARAHVFGVARSVLRDPAQAEEVAQEVLLDVWRDAARFDASRGSAMAWVMTLAHRRAVDRVRSEQASAAREQRAARRRSPTTSVAETVGAGSTRSGSAAAWARSPSFSRSRSPWRTTGAAPTVRWPRLLKVPVGTVKTRMRDGLIRLRDCLGVD